MRDTLAAWLAGATIIIAPLAPVITDPQCFSNSAYKNTHEQECSIDPTQQSGGRSGGGGNPGLVGGILHGLSGGLL